MGVAYEHGWEAFRRRKEGPQSNPFTEVANKIEWARGYADARYAHEHNLEVEKNQRWPY